jgi:hypothetical protein
MVIIYLPLLRGCTAFLFGSVYDEGTFNKLQGKHVSSIAGTCQPVTIMFWLAGWLAGCGFGLVFVLYPDNDFTLLAAETGNNSPAISPL